MNVWQFSYLLWFMKNDQIEKRQIPLYIECIVEIRFRKSVKLVQKWIDSHHVLLFKHKESSLGI